MAISSFDVLFLGRGNGAVSWYRTGMPSFTLGCDWVAVDLSLKGGEDPHNLQIVTALSRHGLTVPSFANYKIVVLQQVFGQRWLNEIMRLRSLGIRVLYEVDDFLHGVNSVRGHAAQGIYTKKVLRKFEMCMRACDGLIVSTDYLAQRYAKFNKRVWVCRNSIDAKRIADFKVPSRATINIGWAGGEGHEFAVREWLPAIEDLMIDRPEVRFVSIGLPMTDAISRRHQDKTIRIPGVSLENFPAALTNFDIAIGPALNNTFFRAKSDLRFLETGALGIPIVASPIVYGKVIENRETGYLADSSESAYVALRRLISDEYERRRIGSNAKAYVTSERSIEKGCGQWIKVFQEVMDARTTPTPR